MDDFFSFIFEVVAEAFLYKNFRVVGGILCIMIAVFCMISDHGTIQTGAIFLGIGLCLIISKLYSIS